MFENDLKSLILYSWKGSKLHFSSQKYLNFDAQNQHNYHSVNDSSDSSETLWVIFKHCLCLHHDARCLITSSIMSATKSYFKPSKKCIFAQHEHCLAIEKNTLELDTSWPKWLYELCVSIRAYHLSLGEMKSMIDEQKPESANEIFGFDDWIVSIPKKPDQFSIFWHMYNAACSSIISLSHILGAKEIFNMLFSHTYLQFITHEFTASVPCVDITSVHWWYRTIYEITNATIWFRLTFGKNKKVDYLKGFLAESLTV